MRIGLDIGGTKTAAVVIHDDGVISDELIVPTGYGAAAVIATAAAVVETLARDSGVLPSELEAVGIGIPGVVDARTGRVSHAVNLGLHGLDLAGELSTLLGTRVHVENDVNAAAMGVYRVLGGGEHGSMAYLNLGTGLAAGLVLGGQLWRGSRGTAGEIGHIPIDPLGPLCACGQHGCLELVASGSAVARLWPSDHPRPVKALFTAAGAGDAVAIGVRSRLIENIAAAVRVLVLTIDVESVVIGGGMSALGAPLLAAVRGELDLRAADSPFLASLDLSERVHLVPDGYPSAAIGAAHAGSTTAPVV